uniref:G_PROTEIN_RECEP_F1_2 domain-containing protein n=1 Tax=Macrostomum lignano TaxID=282301 RepID=A0A1I8HM96_9PLAT
CTRASLTGSTSRLATGQQPRPRCCAFATPCRGRCDRPQRPGHLGAAVVLGNLLVIVAIARDRKVATLQNWFLASLAFADLLLGLLVMPFSLTNQLLGAWVFGAKWCELWLAIDVLMCTASIMNLCLISLDRYWCVSRALVYHRQRTRSRAALMIAVVWFLSAGVCLPPLLGWRKPQVSEVRCELTDEIGYVVYSSMGSFYIPMLIMVVVYAKIFQRARQRTRTSSKPSSSKSVSPGDTDRADEKSDFAVTERRNQSEEEEEDADEGIVPVDSEADGGGGGGNSTVVEPLTELSEALQRKRRLAKAKERRATLVLGLIMGAFVLCWFPFFTTYLLHILCRCVSHLVFDFFFWLGYCNSAINPVIYTVFNKDFRQAFRRILTCRA